MADNSNWVKVKNVGPGPRMLLLPHDGRTLQKGEIAIMRMTENDIKGIQPYVDLKHLELSEASAEDIAAVQQTGSKDIGGTVQTGNPVKEAVNQGDIIPEEDAGDHDDNDENVVDQDADPDAPTHIEHRGFGRWYGFAGEQKITEAMTEDEANAYAEQHKLQAPVAVNPSDEEPAEEPVAAEDETVADESAAEQ